MPTPSTRSRRADLHILKEEGFERAFIAPRQRGGEDGTVQGALELMGIPYTGSGVMASAIVDGQVAHQDGVAVRPACRRRASRSWSTTGTDWDAVVAELGLPIFVKPVHEGRAWARPRSPPAASCAPPYGSSPPATTAWCWPRSSSAAPSSPPLPRRRARRWCASSPGGNYDHQHKYFTDDTHDCPSGRRRAGGRAAGDGDAPRVLGCRGWGRADLISPRTAAFFLLEMNTAPA